MKKILNHLKENWIRHGFETLVVTIGILGAFALNTGNENRKNILIRNDLLKSVHHEFVYNKERLERIKREHELSFRSTDELLKMFPIEIESADLDTIRAKIRGSFNDYTFEPKEDRINFLLNSSLFYLVDDEELKNVLLSWNSIYNDFREDELRAIDYSFNVLYPFRDKNFPLWVDLKDPRFDKKVLRSIEFENVMRGRWWILSSMINPDNIVYVLETMDKIIQLTEPYSDHEESN